MDDAVMRALASSDLFGSLDPAELLTLAQASRVLRYAKGEQIFARGDFGKGMFLVGQGSVALSISSVDGGEAVLAVLRPPQTFGELAVIDGGPRVATATARQPTVLVGINQSEVHRILREHPAVAEALLVSLAGLVRRVDDHATGVMLLDLRTRVCGLLIDAARKGDSGSVRGLPGRALPVPVDLRLTQTELARVVGGSRQQVNRIIMDLEREGAVHRKASRIVAVRPDLLERGASGL